MIIRYSLFILLFILFTMEGTVFQVFAPDLRGSPYQFIPRWMFMLILFIGIFRGRGYGLFYAIIFGVLYDIVYSPVLGVYTFGMGLITYFLSISIPYFKKHLSISVATTVVAVVLLEYYVYGMMILLGVTNLVHEEFLMNRFLPTFLMNTVVIIVVAYPLKKGFQYLEEKMAESN